MRIPLQSIVNKSKIRPAGYYEDVVSHGYIDGESLVIADSEYAALVAKYNPRGPGLIDLLSNFTEATRRWVEAGFPISTPDIFKKRMEACSACEFWDGKRCKVCGCYRLKHWMMTERCPLHKWPEI